uniref:Uncharacterized protein n=1 Tax=Syphacia muris TaxID=451379 RepID=A0A0N5AQD6_9BILA
MAQKKDIQILAVVSSRKKQESIASSSSRPVLSYVTHYSDSGFSSTLSTGSSCSYLPPPPPYRMRGSGKAQRIHRSLSDSKYGTTSHGHMIALPSIRTGGSAHFFQDLQKAQRAGSWTPRIKRSSSGTTFHLVQMKEFSAAFTL